MEYEVTFTVTKAARVQAGNADEAVKIASVTVTDMEGAEVSANLVGPYPTHWRVGDKVMYRHNMEFGPGKGSIGTINATDPGHKGRPGHDYQVFWVTPESGCGSFWTTPDDVVWIPKPGNRRTQQSS